MSYNETLEAFREYIMIGYSPREALKALEGDFDSDEKALKDIRYSFRNFI